MCCGRRIYPATSTKADAEHTLKVKIIDDEFYITYSHPMKKEHYISFVAYVRFDSVFLVKLYPEQGGELRFPQMRGGNMYYYCSNHGLFEYDFDNITKF